MTDQIYYHPLHNRNRLVHILDPDAATCEALSVLFRLEGFQTTFSVDLDSFDVRLDQRRPDVVVVNQWIGEHDGIDVIRRVKAMRTGTVAVALSDRPQVDKAVAAMKAGAVDVITKPIDTERLLRGVRDTLRRDVHIGPGDGIHRPVEIRGFAQLTPRERQVLQLITNGRSNKEAGRQLGISPRTIEVHRARVMEKLGARNTADLMRIVFTS